MQLPEYVQEVMNSLKGQGCPAFLVGGCVRDILLGREPCDYDLATPADMGRIRACFSRVIPIGERHGTMGVMIGNNKIEVSSFRWNANNKSEDVAHQLTNDLAGRDFTINAMAMDGTGRLYDPWGGQRDLENGLIRATGNQAVRLFEEDPLRMLRAVRLSAVYGFTIDKDTWQVILQLNELLAQMAPERVREELNRILVSPRPADGIRLLNESGLLLHIVPELAATSGFDQRSPHHDRDVFEHSLAALQNTAPRLKLRLAAVLHDVAKPACFSLDEKGQGHFYGHHALGAEMAINILSRLKYDYGTIEDVALLVRGHMSRFEKLRKVSLKRLIVRMGEHNLDDLFELQRADIIASAPPYDFTALDQMKRDVDRILEEQVPLQRSDLAVNGNELIGLGYQPGPELGKVLMHLLDVVLENPDKNQRDILLDIARKQLR